MGDNDCFLHLFQAPALIFLCCVLVVFFKRRKQPRTASQQQQQDNEAAAATATDMSKKEPQEQLGAAAESCQISEMAEVAKRDESGNEGGGEG